jgi:hypothetical protein
MLVIVPPCLFGILVLHLQSIVSTVLWKVLLGSMIGPLLVLLKMAQ